MHTQDEPALPDGGSSGSRFPGVREPILKQLDIMSNNQDGREVELRMSSRFQLHGDMIPRSVRRMFDQRGEERADAGSQSAVLVLRGRNHIVQLMNLSPSGAMVRFAEEAYIGESVTLQCLDHGTVAGQVRWLRDGRMGICFTTPLE
jgi:hypothetical protein